MNKIKRQILLLFTLCLTSACTTPAPQKLTEETVSESTVDIRYQLGSSQYRYLANSSNNSSQISSYRDDSLLEKRIIPINKYLEFLTSIESKLSELELVTQVEGCRTPFTIMLITKKEHETVMGCRSEDKRGVLSKILKEGEFLFYSEIK